MSHFRIVDCLHVLLTGREQHGLEVVQRGAKRESPDGDILSDVSLWSHVGTHMAAPLHFFTTGKDVSQLPPEAFVGPAIRLDLRHQETNEPISRDDLRKAGDIREGDRVILWEGRDRLYSQKSSHDRPYLTEEADQWLVQDRKIQPLGTDASGFEVRGGAKDHPGHRILLDNEVPAVECRRNVGAISQSRFFLVRLPSSVSGLDASPVRAVAIGACFPTRSCETPRLDSALLNADHAREEVLSLETAGIDFLHFGVFDGYMVPDQGLPRAHDCRAATAHPAAVQGPPGGQRAAELPAGTGGGRRRSALSARRIHAVALRGNLRGTRTGHARRPVSRVGDVPGRLARALTSNMLAGAALDVFGQEPPRPDNPLISLPNVLPSPHSAGQTVEGLRRMGEITAENMLSVLHGEAPLHAV